MYENEKDAEADLVTGIRFKISQKFKLNCRQQKYSSKRRDSNGSFIYSNCNS